MSNRIPLKPIGELYVLPGDMVKMLCKQENIIRMTTGELQQIKQTVESELNYRENKRWTS